MLALAASALVAVLLMPDRFYLPRGGARDGARLFVLTGTVIL